MSIHRETLGAVEVEALQKDGWRIVNNGPECANGWPCIFQRDGEDGELRVYTLSNDMERWPAQVIEDKQLPLI